MLLILQFISSIIAFERNDQVYIEAKNNTECKNAPLTNIAIEVEIADTVAQANYCLTFKNKGNDSLIEAKLKLPFDTDVVVSDVSLIYKNKEIVGKLKKNTYATDIYNKAKKDKNVALLVQRIQDFLSIDLVGIEPNETFTAKISTYTVLDLKFNYIKEQFFSRYIFPTAMVPRYSPISSWENNLNNSNPKLKSDVSYVFNFNLKTLTGYLDKDSVSLPKDKVFWSFNSLNYTGKVPNDIVVDIIKEAPNLSIGVTIEHFENSTITEVDLPYYYLTSYRNNTFVNLNKNESFVFLIDRSGSMHGNPIQNAKEALKALLQSLPNGTLFEIVGFGFVYENLFGKLVYKNNETFQKALDYIDMIDSNMCGTEIMLPLKYILEQYPDHLIIITDGAVNNNDEIIEFCCKFPTQISIIEIGNYASSHLLKTVTRNTGGLYEFVNEHSHILDASMRIIASIQNGFLINSIQTNCGVLYQNFPIMIQADTVTPFRFFKNNGFQNNETIFINLTIYDYKYNKEFSLIIDQRNGNITVNDIYGKKLHCIALLKAINEYSIFSNEAFQESLRLNLMTRDTSFILVDETSSKKKNKYDKVETVEIPVKIQDNYYDPIGEFDENFIDYELFEEEYYYDDGNELGGGYMSKRIAKKPIKTTNKCQLMEKYVWNLEVILAYLNIQMNDQDIISYVREKNEKLLAGLLSYHYLKNNCRNFYFQSELNTNITLNYSKEMIEKGEKIVLKYLKNKNN